MISIRNRPRIREVGNSALYAQVSGDFAEFRPIGWNPPESRPSPKNRPDGGSANLRIFQDFLKIFPSSRPQNLEALNPPSGPSKWRFRRISADRAESPRISPVRRRTGRVANPRTSEIPRGGLGDISTQSTAESRGCAIPPFRTK